MIKRILDILLSALGLVALSPVMAYLAWRIRREIGSPVFFCQTRPGLHGRPFQMLKFRTMRNALDAQGNVLPHFERLTRLGRVLRTSSLDELPELWNVLKGDMSVVGQRPLLMEYLDYYTGEEMLRHPVRPGVAGLAPISGRNTTTWDDRRSYDVDYVKTRSLAFGSRIIANTIRQVVKREGRARGYPR